MKIKKPVTWVVGICMVLGLVEIAARNRDKAMGRNATFIEAS